MASFRMSSIQFMNNYKFSLNKTYQEQAKIMEQGDGTSIHRASDDPIGYSKLLRYTVSENENDQYHKNVDTAISWMKTSDSVVASIADRMKTFKEKTVAAANSYNTDADFQAIGKEMFSQIEEIVAEANTQQGDRYIFSGQKDTTEPFLLSHDTYERGLAKTLDSKQSAFFKGTSGDDNATLYQMLTLEYEGNTYYLDTQSKYIYTKDFVEEGYKKLITQGYSSITDDDRINTDTNIAETYAFGKIGSMSLSQAWKRVLSSTEEELVRTINAEDINNGDDDELREALKVLYSEDLTTVEKKVTSARDAIVENLKNISALKYNYTFTATKWTCSTPGVWNDSEEIDMSSHNKIYNISGASDELNNIQSELELEVSYSTATISTGARPSNPSTGDTYIRISSTRGTEVTEVSWKPYDSDTGEVSTTATTVKGSEWNNSNLTAKTALAQNLISAVDGYATEKFGIATDADSDGWKADEAINSVLETLSSINPDEDLKANVTDPNIDELAQSEVIYLAVLACKDYKEPTFKVSDAFTNRGEIRNDVLAKDKTATVKYGLQNADGSYSVTGLNISLFSVSDDHTVTVSKEPETFDFITVEQRLISYSGDDNYISMVKMNGANDKSSDIVNLNGNDLFGCDIFDDANSGNEQSGCAMLNNMLTVYTFTNACNEHWLTSDGMTLSDVSHATVTIAETTLGSRLNLYNSVAEMLDNQSTTITNDITNVSGTDVAELATRLMEMTTLYNMALALGGRVLPQSLADYL